MESIISVMLEEWRRQDEISFRRFIDKWGNKFLSDGKPADVKTMHRDIVAGLEGGECQQDELGNLTLELPQYQVVSEMGDKKPFGVTIPAGYYLSQDTTSELLEYALGIRKPDRRLGGGTRSVGGEISGMNPRLAATYIYDLDLTGTERLAYMELLRESGCSVPPSILATTNVHFSYKVEGGSPLMEQRPLVEDELNNMNEVRDKLIEKKRWKPNIRIDARENNFRVIKEDGEQRIVNIDPVFKSGKFV